MDAILLDPQAARRCFEELVEGMSRRIVTLLETAPEGIPLAEARRTLLAESDDDSQDPEALSEAMTALLADRRLELTVDQRLMAVPRPGASS